MKLFLLLILAVYSLYSIEIQKPKTYDRNKNEITNWYMSEKLDGIRAYWNGKELLSKNGNKIHAPVWFTNNFPNFELDGELWTKRDDFENIQNIVLDKTPSNQWNEITYNIFEVPNKKGHFQERLNHIINWQKQNKNKFIKIIPQIKCKNKKHLNIFLDEMVKNKAEGVIIKNPNLEYFTGRSKDILKVKNFFDKEGKVIGINYHTNGLFKSLQVEIEKGITFNLGNGFSKKQKLNPPKIGNIITFKYYSFTKYGKPKFASFLRIRKTE